MKNLVLSLSALCVLSLTSCKDNAAAKVDSSNVELAANRDAASANLPSISFDKTEHDFGKIKNGTPVETKFKYTNTGETMLVLSNIKSTCGCTVPSNYQKEVKPGETAEFTVKFNGKGNGKISKTLTLTTNTEKGNEKVKITAFVEPDPNAPKRATNNAKTAVNGAKSIMQPQQTSTQPGHEGHNHK